MTIEWIAGAALVFWMVLILDRPRRWPAELALPRRADSTTVELAGGVAVIVPARNEAEVLPLTLPALLGQTIAEMHIVLVDDGSSDDTIAVARELASDNAFGPTLQIIEAGVPREGWSGKVHAQAAGYQAILDRAAGQGRPPPEWILLTDSDIRHRPDSIRCLLAQAEGWGVDAGFDLVSVMARLRAETSWEKLIIPAFVFFFQLLYPFRRVVDRRSGVAAAAGGCVLVRRTVLEASGGFATIGTEIIDDVALGRAVKQSGRAIWLGLDPGIVSVRSYDRLWELWRMVSRTAFTQLRYRWDLLLLTLIALGLLLVSPPLIVAVAVAELGGSGVADTGSLTRAVSWSLLAWGFMSMAYLPAVRHHRVGIGWALMLPVAGLFFGLMTASSAIDDWLGRGPSWRGREYPSSREPEG